jgi:hypothetical protein
MNIYRNTYFVKTKDTEQRTHTPALDRGSSRLAQRMSICPRYRTQLLVRWMSPHSNNTYSLIILWWLLICGAIQSTIANISDGAWTNYKFPSTCPCGPLPSSALHACQGQVTYLHVKREYTKVMGLNGKPTRKETTKPI